MSQAKSSSLFALLIRADCKKKNHLLQYFSYVYSHTIIQADKRQKDDSIENDNDKRCDKVNGRKDTRRKMKTRKKEKHEEKWNAIANIK